MGRGNTSVAHRTEQVIRSARAVKEVESPQVRILIWVVPNGPSHRLGKEFLLLAAVRFLQQDLLTCNGQFRKLPFIRIAPHTSITMTISTRYVPHLRVTYEQRFRPLLWITGALRTSLPRLTLDWRHGSNRRCSLASHRSARWQAKRHRLNFRPQRCLSFRSSLSVYRRR